MSGDDKLIQRILLTTDCVGGVWNYTIQLASELAARGYQVLIAAIGPIPAECHLHDLHLDGIRFEHSDYRLEWMDGGCDDLEILREWLLKLEAEFRPDVIHLNSYALADAPFAAPVLVVAHSCVYSWWHAVHGVLPPTRWSAYQRNVAAGLRSATAVVAPTHTMLRSLANNYGIRLFDGHVIPNGNTAVPTVNILAKRHKILAAGRLWDESKNYSILDEVALHLDWPIDIAGSTESPKGNSAFSGRSVNLLGALSQPALHRLMAEAAVFVHPALYEPFGLAILEAANRGCALVLADIPSLRELWDNAALFCSPRDPSAWITTLQAVSSDEDLRSDLACRALARAAQYSTDRMLACYQDLYRRMTLNWNRATQWVQAS
ncbi:MAG: glycosyltransferase family 4 protein [Bryobacteraceae bacterium]